MSRCFPYPPPGYTLSRDSEAALIESIKIQKERENDQMKKDRKREKRDKKEKKNKKLTDEQTNGKPCLDTKGKLIDHDSKAETESLERSGVTMEHKQPVRLHVPASSSESTENSNNRKRPLSPILCQPQPSVLTGKKIVRIRLTKKGSVPDSLANEEQPCSMSGKAAEPSPDQPCSTSGKMAEPFPDQFESDLKLRGAGTISQRLHFKTRGEQRSSFSHQIETANSLKAGAGLTTISQNLHLKTQADQRSSILQPVDAVKTVAEPPFLDSATSKKHKAYLKYTNLFDNWVPPPLEEPSDDDMDWLFKTKNEECHQPEKRQKPTLPCSISGPLSWPRAHYLPEMDLYALPYTVPY